MKIIAVAVDNDKIISLMEEAQDISYKIFTEKEISARKELIDGQEDITKEIEKIIINESKEILVSEEKDYKKLKNAAKGSNEISYSFLTGAFRRTEAVELVEPIYKVLGIESPYAIGLDRIIKKMDKDENLIFWGVGEEKEDEILQTIRDKGR